MENTKIILSGCNNENLLFSEGDRKYILRTHKKDVRTFEKHGIPENRTLQFLRENGYPAPEIISEQNGSLVLGYIEGRTVNDLYGSSGQMPGWIPRRTAELLKHLHGLDASALGPETDRDSFFSRVLGECEEIRIALGKEFPGLFENLAFPRGFSFYDFLPDYSLTECLGSVRSLCHFDVNRKNVVIKEGTDDCVIIDWEAAGIGDPLYDVAIHLQKSRYSPENERQFLDTFLSETDRPDRERKIILLYRNTEAVKYAYTDVVRILEIFSDDACSKKDADDAIARYLVKYVKACRAWGISCPLDGIHLESAIRGYAQAQK